MVRMNTSAKVPPPADDVDLNALRTNLEEAEEQMRRSRSPRRLPFRTLRAGALMTARIFSLSPEAYQSFAQEMKVGPWSRVAFSAPARPVTLR
jgi:hypothetical protein